MAIGHKPFLANFYGLGALDGQSVFSKLLPAVEYQLTIGLRVELGEVVDESQWVRS